MNLFGNKNCLTIKALRFLNYFIKLYIFSVYDSILIFNISIYCTEVFCLISDYEIK